jgi:hypothetical protein
MMRRFITWVAAALVALVFLSFAAAFAADPPHTTIASGPQGDSTLTGPEFSFTSDQQGSTFECSVDNGDFAPCRSPMRLTGLALGPHSFSARAVNTDGVADPAPPVANWNVVASPQDATQLTLSRPKKLGLRIKDFRTLAGTAASPAGVVRVQIALTFGGPDKNFFPPRCWYVDMTDGSLIHQACVLPPYTTVKGTSSWHYSIPKAVRRKVPDGRYVLMVRTINKYGATFFKKFRLTLRNGF